MANMTIYNLIQLYSNKYIFIWTQKSSAFWSMQKYNRIGIPFELRNSKKSWDVFKLLHEIGHMETYKPNQTKAQREFLATQWAINHSSRNHIRLNSSEKNIWQEYIYSFTKRKDKSIYKLNWTIEEMPF